MMKKPLWAVLAIACSCQLFSGQLFADDCGENVDMADSLDFNKLHVECNENPDIVYDPKSGTSLFGNNKKAVNTYDLEESVVTKQGAQTSSSQKSQTPSVPQQNLASPASGKAGIEAVTQENLTPAVVRSSAAQAANDAAATDNAGELFNIREPFSVTGGPQSALNGLFVQMAHYCPAGWEKLKEWSVPTQTGYYLHYQFQCAD